MDEITLRRMAGRLKVSVASLEKDFVLTKILYAISKSELKNKLVFKGGTALNKAYFNYYRLSEDLDFTAVDTTTNYIKKSIRGIAKKLKIELKDENITKYSYVAVFRFTDILNYPNSVNIDINTDERLVLPLLKKDIKHFYDIPPFKIQVMDLRELTAEKIRALIQRKKPRDYYDVWYILKRNKRLLKGMKSLLKKKCENVKVKMDLNEIFLHPKDTRKLWEHHLVELVERLPNFDRVTEELRSYINKIK